VRFSQEQWGNGGALLATPGGKMRADLDVYGGFAGAASNSSGDWEDHCGAPAPSTPRERSTDTPSLHRSQILRDLRAMQTQAAEFSGYAGKSRCFLERRVSKQFVLIHLF
jgi:hypothetical protein